MSLTQPHWHKPIGKPISKLVINNSLTRKKEEFIPNVGKTVGWYACGPTVYDKSHLGHARCYITSDILRRILGDYFGYQVTFVMNITDVDDKIIVGARHLYLFNQFAQKHPTLSQELIEAVETAWHFYVLERFKAKPEGDAWDSFVDSLHGPNGEFTDPKIGLYAKTATSCKDALAKAKNGEQVDLLSASRDVLSVWLDSQFGSTITDPAIFRDFAAYWEDEYFSNMDALNIKRPDVLTRVSEYIPEIVDYVKGILKNEFAYEMNGSVYFDTFKFDRSEKHSYAKLEPWSAGNLKLMQEGEGALASDEGGKRNPADFALWKNSKPGEPAWDSPWGMGRPGWHIECSAMASDILGDSLDIHSGGIDLAFPHHDNEIAQSEGYYNCHQWVNYFMHSGHLHIEGQKMSKSLKNFISIQEALSQGTAAQIRLMFLLHPWDSVLDYNSAALSEVRQLEASFSSFLSSIKSLLRETSTLKSTGKHSFGTLEKELMKSIVQGEAKVHDALCDNFNTAAALLEIRSIVSLTNIYMKSQAKAKEIINPYVIGKAAQYITKMLRVFGVFTDANPDIGVSSSTETNVEEQLWPYMQALSSFRDSVRELSQKKEPHSTLLQLCDQMRDSVLPDLGVVLDDREDGKALIKFVDKESIAKQRQEKAAKEEEKIRRKDEQLKRMEKEEVEKRAKASIVPSQMFQHAEYSAWDENGIPTKDAQGVDIAKSRRKKLEKEYASQTKLFEKYSSKS